MIITEYPDFIKSMESLAGWFSDYALIILGIALLISANWSGLKRVFGRAKSPDWIYLKEAVDYVTYDAKFALPTKNRPMEAFIFMSVKLIEQAARGRKIGMRGRKKDAPEFEILDPDFWRLANFDWKALLTQDGRRASQSDAQRPLGLPDKPNIPVYVDLEINKIDLQRVFPPQNRWDKSRLGKWLRNKWVEPIEDRSKKDGTR